MPGNGTQGLGQFVRYTWASASTQVGSLQTRPVLGYHVPIIYTDPNLYTVNPVMNN